MQIAHPGFSHAVTVAVSEVRLKIAFVDQSRFDYTSHTPLQEPLGGMQAGLASLAVALARRGHAVTVFNGTSQPGESGAVTWVQLRQASDPEAFAPFDLVVANQTGGHALRRLVPGKPMLLWTGHHALEPSVQVLAEPQEAAAWDGFVFNTRWQAVGFVNRFGLQASRCAIINKAFSDVFLPNAAPRPFFFEDGRPPVLYYSSTPFRGLEVLLRAFPAIRRAAPGAVLRVFSSMRPYQVGDAEDRHAALYQACAQTEGVEYVGSLAQPALAGEVARADLLAFPSTYAETGCITLMEAMVSGCLPVCRDLGALRETASGFGRFYRTDSAVGAQAHARVFAGVVQRVIAEAYARPQPLAGMLRRQQQFARREMHWGRRAAQWERMLARFCTGQPPGSPVSSTASEQTLRPWLARLLRTRASLGIVQIGANDGRINDPVYELVMAHAASTRILLIEPQSEIHAPLRHNYAAHPGAHFWCGAIGPPGELALHRVHPRHWERFVAPHLPDAPAYRAPSGFASASMRHVRSHARAGLPTETAPDEAIETLRVPCTDLRSLLTDQFPSFGAVDVLQIDAEGMDHLVLEHCALEHFRPMLINFEHVHLSVRQRAALTTWLEQCGYRCFVGPGDDTLAVRRDLPGTPDLL